MIKEYIEEAESGAFVVFEKEANKNDGSIPSDYCYVLRRALTKTSFLMLLDARGSTSNGYSGFNLRDRGFLIRKATEQEKEEYIRLGKPFDVTKLEIITKDLFIKLL